MKPFDLEAALQGEPVKLRNGSKAFICYKLSRDFKYWDGSPINFNICGYILNFNGDIVILNTAWQEDGKWIMGETKSDRDIIGMYEEPTPTVTLTLPKPFKPKEGDIYFYIHSHETNAYLEVHDSVWDNSRYDQLLYSSGNAFRREEDAQAWIDAMRDAVYE